MIDLKNEIEGLKNNINTEDYKYNMGCIVVKELENETIDKVLQLLDQYNIGELSDGYHTFNSLYEQRMYLFATIVNQNKDKAWKSYKHEDGELCFGGGWFIVGVDTPNGSYTYHYENKYYDLFECEELECGKHWDGHTDKDVDRVLSLANYNIITAPKTIKLSEIVNRLKENNWVKTDIKIDKRDDYTTVDIYYYNIHECITGGFFQIKDNTIYDLSFGYCNPHKWLYALWLTGTIIEDDLQEE